MLRAVTNGHRAAHQLRQTSDANGPGIRRQQALPNHTHPPVPEYSHLKSYLFFCVFHNLLFHPTAGKLFVRIPALSSTGTPRAPSLRPLLEEVSPHIHTQETH